MSVCVFEVVRYQNLTVQCPSIKITEYSLCMIRDLIPIPQLQNLSEDYMRRMNGRIRELSAHTIVSFMFLGRPPAASSEAGDGRAARRYVHLLDALTRDTIQQL